MTHSFSRKDGLFFSAPFSPEFVVLLNFVFKWLSPFHPNQMFAVLFQIPLLDVAAFAVFDPFLSPRKMNWANLSDFVLFLRILFQSRERSISEVSFLSHEDIILFKIWTRIDSRVYFSTILPWHQPGRLVSPLSRSSLTFCGTIFWQYRLSFQSLQPFCSK